MLTMMMMGIKLAGWEGGRGGLNNVYNGVDVDVYDIIYQFNRLL